MQEQLLLTSLFVLKCLVGIVLFVPGIITGIHDVVMHVCGAANERLWGAGKKTTENGLFPLAIHGIGVGFLLTIPFFLILSWNLYHPPVDLPDLEPVDVDSLILEPLKPVEAPADDLSDLEPGDTDSLILEPLEPVEAPVPVPISPEFDIATLFPFVVLILGTLLGGIVALLLVKMRGKSLEDVFLKKVSPARYLLFMLLGMSAGGILWRYAYGIDKTVVVGIAFGLIWSMLVPILFVVMLGGLHCFQRFVAKIIVVLFRPVFGFIKFNTILCQHCFRYTHPFWSRYDMGVRSCEHCQQAVEKTKETGKVILTFGDVTLQLDGEEYALTSQKFELRELPNRVFVFAKPGFKAPKHVLDVSEIYIDTNTCHLGKLERCLTYMVNHPPKGGLKSVKIFYQGELENLGENLKNALRNTFTRIEKIE